MTERACSFEGDKAMRNPAALEQLRRNPDFAFGLVWTTEIG